MTISSTRTWEMTVGQIVIAAMRLAGLLSPEETPSNLQALHGRDQLGLLLKSPAFSQAITRGVVIQPVTLTGLTTTYSLDSSVIEVQGDGWYTATGETGKTPVTQKPQHEYEALQGGAADQIPVAFFADRSASPVTVSFWPGAAAGTVRLLCHRQRADVTDANATLDLEQHWQDAVVQALAGRLAMAASLSADRVGGLDVRARQARVEAREVSGAKVAQQAELDHPTHRAWR